MPTSHYTQIPSVIEAIIEAQPDSLLEVGVGCGKWGVLAREYLDVWDHYFEPWGAKHTRIVGIEIHELYASSAAWKAYDAIYIGDARTLVATLEEDFDCGLMVDVLEHFDHAEGVALLEQMLKRCGKVIIAIPSVFCETLEVWDNPHEIHKAAWTLTDFETLGAVKVYRAEDSFVVTVTGCD